MSDDSPDEPNIAESARRLLEGIEAEDADDAALIRERNIKRNDGPPVFAKPTPNGAKLGAGSDLVGIIALFFLVLIGVNALLNGVRWSDAVFSGVILMGALRARSLAVYIKDEGLEVCNFFSTKTYPWADIARFAVHEPRLGGSTWGSSLGISVLDHHGRRHPMTVFSRWGLRNSTDNELGRIGAFLAAERDRRTC